MLWVCFARLLRRTNLTPLNHFKLQRISSVSCFQWLRIWRRHIRLTDGGCCHYPTLSGGGNGSNKFSQGDDTKTFWTVKLKKKWRFALGNFLVVSDPLVKADAIVVLDGDSLDERLLHSVQLWQSGYAPKVILSARLAKWQTYEDYTSWRHARKLKMFPEDTLLWGTPWNKFCIIWMQKSWKLF